MLNRKTVKKMIWAHHTTIFVGRGVVLGRRSP